MQIAPAPNPTFDAYYQTLNSYAAQGVTHEQATRLAFTHLLETYAKPVNWTLVLEQRLSNGKIPDGTLLGDFRIPRGYWEAKDTGDDLDAEVRAKIKLGYPTDNIIFEDTRRGVLYQNRQKVLEADLRKPSELAAASGSRSLCRNVPTFVHVGAFWIGTRTLPGTSLPEGWDWRTSESTVRMGSPKPTLFRRRERLGRVRLYHCGCEVVGASEPVEPRTPPALAVGDVSSLQRPCRQDKASPKTNKRPCCSANGLSSTA